MANLFIMEDDIYTRVETKAHEIEAELKRLGRWSADPLPPEKFQDMGAFGQKTMAFEQWLQFILLSRIKEIVTTKGDFPSGSNVASYAIRVFEGDYETGDLHELLYQLDKLINHHHEPVPTHSLAAEEKPATDTVGLSDTSIPAVLYTLAGLLPDLDGDSLESQLQTFDTFLSILSPITRPRISAMFRQAALSATTPQVRQRLEKAANDVAEGRRAGDPYNHEAAMKKYIAEHKKRFNPD